MKKLIGDAIEISVVVRDLEAAITRYTELFGLTVHKRTESKEFGFKNAILPLGVLSFAARRIKLGLDVD